MVIHLLKLEVTACQELLSSWSKRRRGKHRIDTLPEGEHIVNSVWEEPLWSVEEVGVSRGWWILTWGGDGGSEGGREKEREVPRDGGVIFALADERFSSPHTSSAGDSTSGLQSISSEFHGHFSSFKYLIHTLQKRPGMRECNNTREAHLSQVQSNVKPLFIRPGSQHGKLIQSAGLVLPP